jgi:multidrug resistance efflux pump
MLGRPSALRQTMQGVWEFLKTPKGIITAVYGFLVVFWGAAIVLFLTKIINLHDANKQGLWVEISSQVENGKFKPLPLQRSRLSLTIKGYLQ